MKPGLISQKMMNDNIRVAVRVRPPQDFEL